MRKLNENGKPNLDSTTSYGEVGYALARTTFLYPNLSAYTKVSEETWQRAEILGGSHFLIKK